MYQNSFYGSQRQFGSTRTPPSYENRDNSRQFSQQQAMQQVWLAYLKMDPMNCIIQPEGYAGGLYLGNIDAAQNVDMLKKHNIDAVLTVAARTGLRYSRNQISTHEIILADDVESFDLSRYFTEMIEFIEKNIKKTNVLVHCFAGVSRSATAVIAYLMKNKKLSFESALSLCKAKRKVTNPNQGFVRQLHEFQYNLQQTRENKKQKEPKESQSFLKENLISQNRSFSTKEVQSRHESFIFDDHQSRGSYKPKESSFIKDDISYSKDLPKEKSHQNENVSNRRYSIGGLKEENNHKLQSNFQIFKSNREIPEQKAFNKTFTSGFNSPTDNIKSRYKEDYNEYYGNRPLSVKVQAPNSYISSYSQRDNKQRQQSQPQKSQVSYQRIYEDLNEKSRLKSKDDLLNRNSFRGYSADPKNIQNGEKIKEKNRSFLYEEQGNKSFLRNEDKVGGGFYNSSNQKFKETDNSSFIKYSDGKQPIANIYDYIPSVYQRYTTDRKSYHPIMAEPLKAYKSTSKPVDSRLQYLELQPKQYDSNSLRQSFSHQNYQPLFTPQLEYDNRSPLYQTKGQNHSSFLYPGSSTRGSESNNYLNNQSGSNFLSPYSQGLSSSYSSYGNLPKQLPYTYNSSRRGFY